jgi:hypothetical protein
MFANKEGTCLHMAWQERIMLKSNRTTRIDRFEISNTAKTALWWRSLYWGLMQSTSATHTVRPKYTQATSGGLRSALFSGDNVPIEPRKRSSPHARTGISGVSLAPSCPPAR